MDLEVVLVLAVGGALNLGHSLLDPPFERRRLVAGEVEPAVVAQVLEQSGELRGRRTRLDPLAAFGVSHSSSRASGALRRFIGLMFDLGLLYELGLI